MVVQIYYVYSLNRRMALLEEEHMKWVHLVQQGFTTARDADVVISEQLDDLRNRSLRIVDALKSIENSEKK